MHRPKDAFPFRRVLDLSLLIAYWRQVVDDPASPHASLAAVILEQLNQTPDLERPTLTVDDVSPHRALLELMMTALLPPARSAELCAAAFPPLGIDAFYRTPAYERLEAEGPIAARLRDIDVALYQKGKVLKAYSLILKQCYDIDAEFEYPLFIATTHPETGLEQHWGLDIDTRFLRVKTRGRLPKLSENDLQHLLAEPLNFDLWTRLLPPDHFEFYGFSLISAVDVTGQEVLSLLKRDLLQKDALALPAHIDQLQNRLRAYTRCADLHLGLICLEHDDLNAIRGARAVGRSLLLSKGEAPICNSITSSVYAKAFESCDPVIVHDLTALEARTGFEEHLVQQGFRNLVVVPLRVEDRLVGLLELASSRPGVLHAVNTIRLFEVFMLFATALERSLNEQEDHVQAVIKKQCTAIHPVVEWRFREAARRYIEQQAEDHQARLEPIVFKNVYPLYGLSDIRNSAEHRNAAIQADLIEQLGRALAVVVEASMYRSLPVLDELGYRIHASVEDIEQGLRSEYEVGVLEFLQQDIEPLFAHLQTFGPTVRERIEAYRASLDPTLGLLYQRRKEYEESVAHISDAVAAYLEVQQRQAQAMLPHYFEHFKTDGVDYNIYIGASLLEDQSFDRLYLRNLRLWQLMTMCGVVWEMERLQPQLNMPLETAHLILVQDTPLSIRFRSDEKRFDVDGAYNVRYEIIKKRIDKALVRGSQERLTQPGKLAIVYGQPREAAEYRRYIAYLQASGYLLPEIEELELEDMQGVQGLKALRVAVGPAQPNSTLQVHTLQQFQALEAALPATNGRSKKRKGMRPPVA